MTDRLLPQLSGVRQTGDGRYIAKCPAHDDRSPSLSIRLCDDGRALVHCFAGCETENVLAAVGLTFSDVMPEPVGHHHRPVRNAIPVREALALIDHEVTVVAIVAADFLEHREIDEPTWERLSKAVERINSMRTLCAPARVGR